jgi:putative ABC transport system permease protein
MTAFEAFRSALDALRQNRVRALLTTLGVIIGVMSVILLIALGEAAQNYVEQEFAELGSNILIVTPGKQETTGIVPIVAGSLNPLSHADARAIERKVSGHEGVASLVIGAGYIQFGDRRRNTTIGGVTEDFDEVRRIRPQVGRPIERSDIEKNARVCIIGTRVKQELFGDAPALHQRVTINRMKHTVIGILEPRGMTLGLNLDDIVLVALPSAQQMFYGGEDRLFEILVAARSKDDVPHVAEQVRRVLIAEHGGVEDFTITDQDGMLGTFGKIFDALRVMLAGIAAISLLVGGIGIMNIMLVSVQERTREVGIRKAVGARNADILRQFLIESVLLSLVGGAIGVGLAYLGTIAMGILYPIFPVTLSLWSIATAFLFSMAVGVFFGVYPAAKAAEVDPVEALRYE